MSRQALSRILLLAAASVAACLALAAPAGASSHQISIMHDDQVVLRSGFGRMTQALQEFRRLGADAVKVHLYWNEVSPRTRPAHPTDPNAYNWCATGTCYGDVVRVANSLGLQVYFDITLSTSGYQYRSYIAGRSGGVYRPSTRYLQWLAEAAGRKFPTVRTWAIWNEPNLYSWLRPQRGRHGVPLSPSVYRNLYLAAHHGLVVSGHGGDTILIGELSSTGSRGTEFANKRVGPLEFLREMVCLNSRYRAYRGRSAGARGCGRVGRIPTSGFAYHPYTYGRDPRARRAPGDAGIAQLAKVTRVLDAIARRGRLPRRLPIWISEYGFQTNPPDPFQAPIGRVPGWMDESEWLAFRSPRVRSYSHYQLVDDAPFRTGSRISRWGSWQSGLYFRNGVRKAGVYHAWEEPFFVRLRRGRLVEIFGGLRRAGAGVRGTILARLGRGRYHVIARVTLNSRGYFRKFVRLSRANKRNYRLEIAGAVRTGKRPVRW